MELRHLRYFVAVAEMENVTRAALKLHVSQPALSKQIRDLEEELGFSLLERSAKSVRLTAAGQVFLVEARQVLKRADEAVQAARAVADGSGLELHVGYATSPTVRLLPPTLRAFQAEMPKVRVRLHDLSTEDIFARVRDGKLDVAFIVKPGPAMLRGLDFRELARERLCIAVSPNHSFARRHSVNLADVAQEPLIALSEREYPDYHELLEGLFAKQKVRPRVKEEHDSVSSLIASVEAGNGAAVVAESIDCIAGLRLKLLTLLPAAPPLIVGAAWDKKKKLSLSVRRFLDCAGLAVKTPPRAENRR
jgi:DNA-binding transcriptional LysR family regulator